MTRKVDELSMSLSDLKKSGINKNAYGTDKDKLKKDLEKLKKGLAKEEAPATSVGNASVAMPPSMRPKVVVDRRHKKDKTVMLKRFRKYMEDNG